MNALTISSKSPIIDRRSSDDLAIAKNLMIRDYPAAPEMLQEPMPVVIRGRLEQRKSMLEQWLAPAARADHQAMAKAIAGMLGSFAANSSGSPEATTAKYVQIMADLPAWAVLRACEKIESGEAEGASLDYRPSAPRVKDVARALMAPWLEELFHIRAALNAPVLEPENAEVRKRLGALFSKFAADFRIGKFREASPPADQRENGQI